MVINRREFSKMVAAATILPVASFTKTAEPEEKHFTTGFPEIDKYIQGVGPGEIMMIASYGNSLHHLRFLDEMYRNCGNRKKIFGDWPCLLTYQKYNRQSAGKGVDVVFLANLKTLQPNDVLDIKRWALMSNTAVVFLQNQQLGPALDFQYTTMRSCDYVLRHRKQYPVSFDGSFFAEEKMVVDILKNRHGKNGVICKI